MQNRTFTVLLISIILVFTALPVAAQIAQPEPVSAPGDAAAASATPQAATPTAQVSATAPPVTTLSAVPGEQPPGTVEKKGAVIKTDGLNIYTDLGILENVSVGATMEIFRMEPIRNLQGEVLDEEEVPVGLLEITEVRPRVSLGSVAELYTTGPGGITTPVERGFFVRFWAPESKYQPPERTSTGLCPQDMLLDEGGLFVFVPASYFDDIPRAKEQTGETEAFCIDIDPAPEEISWAEARRYCADRGKRMCEKVELQKVCAAWEKPLPCPPEIQRVGQCPESVTVEEFNKDDEWVYEMAKENGEYFPDAFACACTGADPICVHCLYRECRGATKKFRCCKEPYPAPSE